jgi:CMP/dCMP kinase
MGLASGVASGPRTIAPSERGRRRPHDLCDTTCEEKILRCYEMAAVMLDHCAINGEIGSGKTSVAKILGEASGRGIVNAGTILRETAAALGVTALEANRMAERDDELDARIDQVLLELGQSNSSLIFDSRVSWYLLPSAFKVHLIVDPDIAARRLFAGRDSKVEKYRSVEEAKHAAEERYQSERRRFYHRHGIDIARLRNYDLVLDTSDAEPASIAAEIQVAWAARRSDYPLRVSPRRVRQLQEPTDAWAQSNIAESADRYPAIIYSRPNLFARQMGPLAQALSQGEMLVPALLIDEDPGASPTLTAAEWKSPGWT